MKEINIVGIGMGNLDTLTIKALNVIKKADMLIGADRMINSLKEQWSEEEWSKIKKDFSITSLKIMEAIESVNAENIVVLMSGDTGFFSGTKKLAQSLEEKGLSFSIVPGISSLSYLSAKVAQSWDNVRIFSLHGRKGNPASYVRSFKSVFFLLDKVYSPNRVCKELVEAGFGSSQVIVGENLSYDNEKITRDLAVNLVDKDFDALAVMLVNREDTMNFDCSLGIGDDHFIRGKVPMTKEEVRTVSISKLQLKEDDIIYDVGAGTGSVSIEMAIQAPFGIVYAIETKEEAVALIEENKKHFNVSNLNVVSGLAPDALDDLPPPDKVFIGGSKGNLKEIMITILQKNPKARFVINAIALETLGEALNILKELGFEDSQIIQMAVTRTKKVASYTMLDAINPIFILTGQKN